MPSFWLLLALLLIGGPVRPALSQTPAGGDWSPPQNLSQSGAAADPLLFVDKDGLAYVLWRDALAGPMLTQGVLNDAQYNWLPPAPVAFPFGAFRPTLVAAGETIYAFWIDAAALLQVSWVARAEFAAAAAWAAPQPLAERALTLSAAAGPDGRLHLAYLARQAAAAAPAGIFYQQSAGSTATWSEPALLYQSPYLRAQDAGSATLQLAASPAGPLFLVWDNPPLEQIFFSRSPDGGATWDEPIIVDQRAPDDRVDGIGPARPLVYAGPDATVHLGWTAGHNGDTCRLYHQWSADNGATWRPAQPLPLTDCPQTGQWLAPAGNSSLLLFAVLPSQPVLLAWDGQQWSLPQSQTGLSAFRHPDTYRPLALSCQQMALAAADRLLLVGCDAAQSQDIWAAIRPLAALADWFPPPPVWSEPAALAAAAGSAAPALAIDGDGLVHLVWSQPDAGDRPDAIHYARWDGANWSLPVPVLTLPGAAAGPPGLVADNRGRLLLVAAGGNGALYFSQTVAAAAASGSSWSEPLALPQPQTAAVAPVIAAAADGSGRSIIYVAYAVPFNEARGIYLTQSADGGQSWSEPVTVFAAATAGWEGVSQPRLAVTAVDDAAASVVLHVAWARAQMPSFAAATALYASQSTDGGLTFASAEIVTDDPLRWYDLLTGGPQMLHRFWQTADDSRSALWHQVSWDGGLTWQAAQRVSTQSGPAAAAAGLGQAQLLQWTADVLRQWQWQGDQWLLAESLSLPAGTDETGVTTGITPNGSLLALLRGSAADPDTLFFTSRRLSLPPALPAPRPLSTSTPPPQLSPTLTPTPAPTPTLTFPREADAAALLPPSPASSSSLLLRVVFSVIPAGIFVILVLFRGLQKRRER